MLVMEFFDGQTVTIAGQLLTLRNYTEADLEDLHDWSVYTDYGFEFSIPTPMSHAVRVPARNWLDSYGFRHVSTIQYHDRRKWLDFEVRTHSTLHIDLAPILHLPTFIVRWHVGDIGLLVARRDNILWVEELAGVGSWQSIQEMFAY
jgi:hypothetical protein